MRGALSNKYLVYLWPLRPASNIQVYGSTKICLFTRGV